MSDLREICTIIGVALGVFAAIFVVLMLSISYGVERPTCYATAAAMHVPATWGLWTDCIITVDGRTIPLEAYKIVRVSK